MPARVDRVQLALLRRAALASEDDRVGAAAVFSDYEAERGREGAAWVRVTHVGHAFVLRGHPVLFDGDAELNGRRGRVARLELDDIAPGGWTDLRVWKRRVLVVPDEVQATHAATRDPLDSFTFGDLLVGAAQSRLFAGKTPPYGVLYVRVERERVEREREIDPADLSVYWETRAATHDAILHDYEPELVRNADGTWVSTRGVLPELWNLVPMRGLGVGLRSWRAALALLRKALR